MTADTVLLPAEEWHTAPEGTPQHALSLTWQWLEHQANGNTATRTKALQLLGDQGNAEDRVRRNYTGRAAIELLQNAHDACADAGVVGRAWFRVTSTALLVGNEGVQFTHDRIISLTRLGASDKSARRETHHLIGYKGIGFTSVFELSDNPQIISADVAFQFDRARAQREVSESLGANTEVMPARAFPFRLSDEEWADDAAAVAALREAGAVSVIRLPLRADRPATEVAAGLREAITPEVLLFMRHLRSFDIDDGSSALAWERSAERRHPSGRLVHLASPTGGRRRWLVASGTAPLSATEAQSLRDPLWADVRNLNVTVALPWSDRGPDPTAAPQRLFAYFPTEARLGRRVLVHGDFYLDDSRRHIEATHERGVVSRRVAETAAALVAGLAEQNAGFGSALLACLAPIDERDGYGQQVGELIDERLRQARFLRNAEGTPSRPAALSRLSGGTAEFRRDVHRLLDPLDDVLNPEDALDALSGWLQQLGVQPLGPQAIAGRIQIDPNRMSYDRALSFLHDWLDELSGVERAGVVGVLRNRPVVLDDQGQWQAPTDAVLPSPEAPPLPPFLRRPTARPPRSQRSRELLDTLGVDYLNAERALDIVVTAHEGGEAVGDGAARQTWAFLKRLWLRSPEIIRARQGDLDQLRVPVSTARGSSTSWEEAQYVYARTDLLKDAYGPAGEAEFLTLSPADAGRYGSLAKAMGVADKPRVLPLDLGDETLEHRTEWWELPEVRAARQCSAGHPYSPRGIEGEVVDRLDWLLEHNVAVVPRLLRALAAPYGPPARVRCENTSHGWSAPWRTVTGYQDWRLRTSAWVPVVGDPAGRKHRAPDQAWTEVPNRAPWLLLPRASMTKESARSFGLVNAERPPIATLEEALNELATLYPEPGDAPDTVRRTAEWLARRLDRVLTRAHAGREPRPPFLAAGLSGPVWTDDPRIADVAGFPLDDSMAVLPSGRWQSLRSAYGLQRLSDISKTEVTVGVRRRVVGQLPARRRAELLALLAELEVDPKEIAGRLAGLVDQTVSRLTVTWSVEGRPEPATTGPDYHLDVVKDAAGRSRLRATLYLREGTPFDPLGVGHALAEYLDTQDQASAIQLFLSDGEALLRHHAIGQDEVEEALELIRSRRWFIRDQVAEAPSPRPAEEEPAAEGGEEPTSSTAAAPSSAGPASADAPAPSAGRRYIDPATVTFGEERHHAADKSATRKQRGAGGNRKRSTHSYETPPARDYSGPLIQNRDVEERAVETFVKYAMERLGATDVIDRQRDNCGWDLDVYLRDGRTLPIEVKGSSGHTPFILSPNELRVARATPGYTVYHVAGIADPPTAVMYRFEDIGTQLPDDDALSVSGWAVVGWQSLEYVAIDVGDLDGG